MREGTEIFEKKQRAQICLVALLCYAGEFLEAQRGAGLDELRISPAARRTVILLMSKVPKATGEI